MEENRESLLPCPWCGGTDIRLYQCGIGGERVGYMQCYDCTSCGPDHIKGRHWNKRFAQPPSVQLAECKRLADEWVQACMGFALRPGPETNDRCRELEKACKAALDRLAAPAAGWIPIETAPKDGTRVLLSWNGVVVLGFYLDNSTTHHPWAGWRVPSMEVRPPGRPSHWMPLPAAPTIDNKGG